MSRSTKVDRWASASPISSHWLHIGNQILLIKDLPKKEKDNNKTDWKKMLIRKEI